MQASGGMVNNVCPEAEAEVTHLWLVTLSCYDVMTCTPHGHTGCEQAPRGTASTSSCRWTSCLHCTLPSA